MINQGHTKNIKVTTLTSNHGFMPWVGVFLMGLALIAAAIAPFKTEAAFNSQINYQGKLVDSSGVPVADGTYEIVFKLYTGAIGGVAVWTETRSGGDEVTVTDGLFSVMLGEVASLSGVDFNQTLYLGVTIESDSEMTPRKKLGAVPAAFQASYLEGLSSGQFLRSDANTIYSSGTLTTNSGTTVNIEGSLNFGIGTGILAAIGGTVSTTATSSLGLLTTHVTEGSNQYFTNTRARAALSSSALGLSYDNSTGIFTLTSGYVVPLTASTTEWADKISSQWTTSGTDISYSTGNVGIGTSTPVAKLAITGTSGATIPLFLIASSTQAHVLSVTSAGNLGIGPTTTSAQNLLTISNFASSTALKSSLFSVDQLQISQLEGGAYFGGTRVSENQWGLSNVGVSWNAATTTNRNWARLAMSSDGKLQTALSYGGQIYTSSDFGNNWIARDSTRNWYGVAMSADGKIQTALESGGQVYVSTDYGATWAAKAPSTTWNTVAMSSDGRIQLGGTTGDFLYISKDYGLTWTPKATSMNWYSVSMSSDGRIQAATAYTQEMYVSTDYGDTWSAKDTNRNWFSVAMSADGKIQAAVVNGGQIYVSTNYGDTWSAKDSNRDWSAIAMSAEGRVQAATVYGGQVYVSSDFGSNWTAQGLTKNWNAITVSSDARIQSALADFIYVSRADSYIDGNIGIGTSTPSAKLAITGTSGVAGDLFVVASSTNARFLTVTSAGKVGVGTSTGSAIFSLQGVSGYTGQLFDIASSTGASYLHVTSSGNVGIGGLTAPTSTLAVKGSGAVFASSGEFWTARTGLSATWRGIAYGNGVYVAVAEGGADRVMTSPDGITWTARTAAAANSWYDVTFGNGVFVAISFDGGASHAMTSPDGITWTLQTTLNSSWLDITYGNGLFVAAATSAGTHPIMTSPDGISWTIGTAPTISLSGITYGNGLYVAVSQGGSVSDVITSPDAITWTQRTTPIGAWKSVTYGNGIYVAVGQSNGANNYVMTSPDGTTWTARSAASAASWQDVTFGNGVFVAVSYNATGKDVMTSVDGINWTSRHAPTSNGDNRWGDVVYGDNKFVAVSFNTLGDSVMTSSGTSPILDIVDASGSSILGISGDSYVTIGTATSSARLSISGIVGDPRDLLFIASSTGASYLNVTSVGNVGIGSSTPSAKLTVVGSDATSNLLTVTASTTSPSLFTINNLGNVSLNTSTSTAKLTIKGDATSPGVGVNWVSRATESNTWTGVTYGNGTFVAVANSGTNSVMSSVDGVTWVPRTQAQNNQWQGVAYGNGIFVAVANTGSNKVMTSPDGITWTVRNAASSRSWRTVTYGNGLFVAIDGGLGVVAGQVMTSPDGITWTSRTSAASNQWRSVTYAAGVFVATGDNFSGSGSVMTSPDGITWTSRTGVSDSLWHSVTYGNSVFVAVSSGGTTTSSVMTSPDGTTWTARPVSTELANNWTSVTYTGNLFVVVGEGGSNRVMTSPDGITWTPRNAAVNNTWTSVTYGNNMAVAVSNSGAANNRVMTSVNEASAFVDITDGGDASVFKIAGSGNVGIGLGGKGTTTPTEKLHVNGNVLIDAQTDSSVDWAKRSSTTAGTIDESVGATVSIASTTVSAVYNGSLYVGTNKLNSAEVYRYDGNGVWTQLNITGTAGKFNTTTNIDAVSSMTVWNGHLYIGTKEAAAAEVYRYDGGTTWTQLNFGGTAGRFLTTTVIDSVPSMAAFNGSLFISTAKLNAAEVYRFDGGPANLPKWTVLNTTAGTLYTGNTGSDSAILVSAGGFLWAGGTTAAGTAVFMRWSGIASAAPFALMHATPGTFVTTGIDSIASMAAYNGAIYIGTDEPNAAEIYKYDYGTAATQFVKVSTTTAGTIGMVNGSTATIDRVQSMTVYNGVLYAGTFETGKAEIYRYDGGSTWTKITNATAGGISVTSPPTTGIEGVTFLQEYNGKLYAGTEEVGATEIYEYQNIEGMSYALKFHAAADNANAEQNGNQNLGTISFMGEQQNANSAGGVKTGTFVFSNGITTAFGAYDLAEDYATRDDTITAGDLVSIDAAERTMVRKSSGRDDRNVIGIYSEQPALRLSQKDATIDGARAIPVALAGRVPVKVSLENGPINIGDYLTMGSTPGVAAKASKPGRVIGRALSAYSGAEGEEPRVTVFIGLETITWNEISSAQDDAEVLAETGEVPETIDSMTALANSIQEKAEDLALAVLSKVDNLSMVITNKLVAISASIKDLFVQTLSIMPGGNIFLPSGENQISGSGVITASTTGVFIENSQIDENTLISITPASVIDSPIFVSEKRVGKGFVVGIAKPSLTDVIFDWFFVKKYKPNNKKEEKSVSTSTVPVEVAPPSPDIVNDGPALAPVATSTDNASSTDIVVENDNATSTATSLDAEIDVPEVEVSPSPADVDTPAPEAPAEVAPSPEPAPVLPPSDEAGA